MKISIVCSLIIMALLGTTAFAQDQEGMSPDPEGNRQKADDLWNLGRMAYEEKRYADAVTRFNESLRSFPDNERKNYVERLIAALNENARIARDQGEVLQAKGKLREAVEKYRESLLFCPNPSLDEHIRKVEARIAEEEQEGRILWEQCRELYMNKKKGDAFRKCTESYRKWPEPSHKDVLSFMSARNTDAKRLRDEGESLQNEGKLVEAMARFELSLLQWPNENLEQHVRLLERTIKSSQGAKIQGIWEQVDGACRGSRYYITQRGNTVSDLTIDTLCSGERGQAAAEDLRNESHLMISYTYRFTRGKGSPGGETIVFTSDNEAFVQWKSAGGSGTTRLQKVSP